MGVRYLNRFLLQRCKSPQSISKQNLKVLENKVIAVDTSIYMYKFIGVNALLEQFYLMISVFRKYNMIPVFVFDGKSPPEKNATLTERTRQKELSKQKYDELQKEVEKGGPNVQEIQIEMESLKKQFIKIKSSDVKNVKQLMQYYGVNYLEAPGEADHICAELVISGKAWACLSEDMDMLPYGCNRILRHLSLTQNTVLLYDMESILTDLQMNLTIFREMVILAGTDCNDSHFTIHDIYEQYLQHHPDSLYSLLNMNDAKIQRDMFSVNDTIISKGFINKSFDMNCLKQFMSRDGFIFV